MSAFVVSDKTINIVLSYLRDNPSVDADISIRYIRNLLGPQMLALNENAVAWRYGEPVKTREFKFQYELVPNPIWAYSSLKCWLYQCSEGDFIHDPLYLKMEEVSHIIAMKIVDSLPEYDEAPWDD